MTALPTGRPGGRRGRPWLLLALLLVVVVGILLWPSGGPRPLEIVFLDVGQADATLIRTPDDRIALIDGGRSRALLLEVLAVMEVTRFDLVVATHADFDHIAGLVAVMEHFEVANVMDNGVPHTTQTYLRLLDAMDRPGVRYLAATERTLTLGDATLTVLPPPLESDDQNGNSVGILLRYGDFSVLLPGDATDEEQRVWLRRYRDSIGDIDVYKAAHHGSSTGDGPEFVSALTPEVVVVSAGLDNSYGHPHREALASYAAVDATVYRTDLDGSITVRVAPGGGSYDVVAGKVPLPGGGGGWLLLFESLLGDLLGGL